VTEVKEPSCNFVLQAKYYHLEPIATTFSRFKAGLGNEDQHYPKITKNYLKGNAGQIFLFSLIFWGILIK